MSAADRVRAFLTAQAEEDAASRHHTTDLADAVPQDGSALVTLYTADLRELLNDLEAAHRGTNRRGLS